MNKIKDINNRYIENSAISKSNILFEKDKSKYFFNK